MVPDDIKHDFVKANRVYYVVLSPCLEKSDKLITSCRGCNGKITLEEKKLKIYMDNVNFRALKLENRHVLQQKNHLEAILETCEKLAQDGHL